MSKFRAAVGFYQSKEGNLVTIRGNSASSLVDWFTNLFQAIGTVANAFWVTIRNWGKTYHPIRKTFTEHFEYPELPLTPAPRYRGFHRYDLTSCIACDRCARECPVDCIYIGKERVEGRKGFRVTSFVIDYTKCMFCGICTESCPVDCIFMGGVHDLSAYRRDYCIVDFSRIPPEIAWGRATLNPAAVVASKHVVAPVHGGPNQ